MYDNVNDNKFLQKKNTESEIERMNQGDLKKNDYFVLLRVKNVIWL